MLKGKTVLLGVTGSIAAYKIAELASMLVKQGADVHVLMTENATRFINKITFETLTRNKCIIDTFDRDFEFKVEHVALAKAADVFMIAPASADVIGKLACGIADDMLTTTALACTCPIIVSPAMNTAMYENKIVQDNLKKLRNYGFRVIDPDSGFLACRDVGPGKMPSPEKLFKYITHEISSDKYLAGKKVLVTAGPTVEDIDPVRYITNHSTGKMGYAAAEAAADAGADVTLVSGPVELEAPLFVKVVNVRSSEDMFNAVTHLSQDMDIIIKAAAVADYTPKEKTDHKIKKNDHDAELQLVRTRDILAWLGEHKPEGQKLVGFSMETDNMIENSRKKLLNKNLDMVVANNLKVEGAGFGTDTNVVTFITKDGEEELPVMSKADVAVKILRKAVSL